MKKGFTLIELLVVVLIIGILSAVALPNYRNTVLKTKVQGTFPLMKAVSDAQARYFLANNEFATKFDDLDVAVPGTCNADLCNVDGHVMWITGDRDITMYYNTSAKSGTALTVSFVSDDKSVTSTTYGYRKGDIVCLDRGNAIYSKVCQSMGGKNPVSVGGSAKSWFLSR